MQYDIVFEILIIKQSEQKFIKKFYQVIYIDTCSVCLDKPKLYRYDKLDVNYIYYMYIR